MTISELLTPEIIEFIKVIAIIIGLVHLLAGFILVFQTFRMNRIIKTPNAPIFSIIAIIYIAVLMATLILILSA
jgi:succinate dehydrogenase/fumarate reductase cytochrome b subunit